MILVDSVSTNLASSKKQQNFERKCFSLTLVISCIPSCKSFVGDKDKDGSQT